MITYLKISIFFIFPFLDVIIMTIHYKQIGEIFYVFHHGASIYAYYYAMASTPPSFYFVHSS